MKEINNIKRWFWLVVITRLFQRTEDISASWSLGDEWRAIGAWSAVGYRRWMAWQTIAVRKLRKRKLKQWWSQITSISTKRTITSHLNWTQYKTKTYDVGNLGPSLGQTQQCGGVKPVNGDPTNPPLLITGSPTFKYGVEVDNICWKTSEFGVEVDYRCWKTPDYGVEVQCILDVGKRRSLVSK